VNLPLSRVITRLDDNVTPEISTLKSAIFTGLSHSDPFNKNDAGGRMPAGGPSKSERITD
jgi:hypothetical protein